MNVEMSGTKINFDFYSGIPEESNFSKPVSLSYDNQLSNMHDISALQIGNRLKLTGEEDVLLKVLSSMSREINVQSGADRQSITEFKRKCREMRKKIQELTNKIKKEESKSRKRGLLAKIFKWAAVALAAIASVATAIFTGGGSVVAYGVAIAAAIGAGALGCASGGCQIASSYQQKQVMEGQVKMMKIQMNREIERQIKEDVMLHVETLFELDNRVGMQACEIIRKYDDIRKQIIMWR